MSFLLLKIIKVSSTYIYIGLYDADRKCNTFEMQGVETVHIVSKSVDDKIDVENVSDKIETRYNEVIK